MRVCRFINKDKICIGLYHDSKIVNLKKLYDYYTNSEVNTLSGLNPFPTSLLQILPPSQSGHKAAKYLEQYYFENGTPRKITHRTDEVKLLAPIPNPPKLFLLAGNYAEHIKEGEGKASGATFKFKKKKNIFPYFFMKPLTTITNPGDNIKLPKVSPDHIDWEVELGVVIGRKVKSIAAKDALGAVAGYTIINDVSDREFRPNPHRKKRPMDQFFDWLHGKWHDSFAPIGPCITSSKEILNPQSLDLSLKVNKRRKQHSNTSFMIFSVAELISFISKIVTLQPGDIISTGTPAGIGATTGIFLKPGDKVSATIEGIGTLENLVSN